jgi:hypothetical protein
MLPEGIECAKAGVEKAGAGSEIGKTPEGFFDLTPGLSRNWGGGMSKRVGILEGWLGWGKPRKDFLNWDPALVY